jgi:peptide/nickel transport system permease protein
MTVITSGLIGITLGGARRLLSAGASTTSVLFAITTAPVDPGGAGRARGGRADGDRASGSWSRPFGCCCGIASPWWRAPTTMQVRTLDYVSAAWCAGASTPHIPVEGNPAEHREPPRRGGDARDGARHPARGRAVVLGLGVPPPLPSWG